MKVFEYIAIRVVAVIISIAIFYFIYKYVFPRVIGI